MTTFNQPNQSIGTQQNVDTIFAYYAAAVPTPGVPPQMLSLRAQPFVGHQKELIWLLQQLNVSAPTIGLGHNEQTVDGRVKHSEVIRLWGIQHTLRELKNRSDAVKAINGPKLNAM